MRKMEWTKRRTLEVCRDLWQWLADNLDKEKGDWPSWEYNGGKIPYCESYCPLCEYKILCRSSCDSCLLWGKGEELEGHCQDYKSPYWRGCYSKDSTVRKAAALEIVAACNRALAKLSGGIRRQYGS